MRRGPYAKVAVRNAALLERIRELKAEHPFWGYRRIWAHLRYVDGLAVNQRRVYGAMKTTWLLVKPNPKLRARRKADTKNSRPRRPNEWWVIDMTKVMIEGFGWVYLVVVLDWHSKKVVGHYAGLQARPWHWLVALNRAVNRQFPHGIEGQSLNLMADNGCQPTSLAFTRLRRPGHSPGFHLTAGIGWFAGHQASVGRSPCRGSIPTHARRLGGSAASQVMLAAPRGRQTT